jgi:hypothetical protein
VRIASAVRNEDNAELKGMANDLLRESKSKGIPNVVYFPDLIVLNKPGLIMMAILKIIWLIAGGWVWRMVRNTIFKKIKNPTFQSPTTVGVFMVVMPLLTLIILLILLLAGCPWYYILVWLFIMWAGTLIRPPLDLITKLITMQGDLKYKMRKSVLALRNEIEKGILS